MNLRLDKCEFFKDTLIYVGWEVTANGIRPDPKYVKRIFDIAEPTTAKACRSLLGNLM